ncbi:MAG: carbohydrate binding domain-containing protein, partial [Lentisphaeria bacterium]|nr:carbohydrate binding domain-containing protein [Lentisphaeria bacterium]
MKKLLLAVAAVSAASALSGANLLPGDTSYETEPDTLTSGNLDPGYLPFAWDDREAFHGKRSLRVDWDAKNRRGSFYRASDGWVDNHICLDTADLENGKRYTFSFYAKAEHDKAPLSLWLCPNAAWGYWPKKSNYFKTFRLTTQWQRYSFTFTADLAKNPPFKGYSCLFGFKKADPGKFWIDAVQLDEGETATEYQPSAPMSCGIRLDVPDGRGDIRSTVWSVYYPTDRINGTVRVASNDGKGGKLTVRTIDWQGKTVAEFSREVKGGEAIAFKADP